MTIHPLSSPKAKRLNGDRRRRTISERTALLLKIPDHVQTPLWDKFLSKVFDISMARRRLTSLTRGQLYPQFCQTAANDLRVFNTFRRHPVYNKVLEHITRDQGEAYLAIIEKAVEKDSGLLDDIDRFKENDRVGKPRVYAYPSIGEISPTTLRYIKVLMDLKERFSSLDGFRVCEIGVGYGGLCRIVDSSFAVKTYCLVDLKPVLLLAQRYLEHFIIRSMLEYKTMNEMEPREFDLVISNYAFSELPRSIQDVYMEKAILRAKRGYITYNEILPPEVETYHRDELVDMIPGARILDEVPLTGPNNCIIVWGDEAPPSSDS